MSLSFKEHYFTSARFFSVRLMNATSWFERKSIGLRGTHDICARSCKCRAHTQTFSGALYRLLLPVLLFALTVMRGGRAHDSSAQMHEHSPRLWRFETADVGFALKLSHAAHVTPGQRLVLFSISRVQPDA